MAHTKRYSPHTRQVPPRQPQKRQSSVKAKPRLGPPKPPQPPSGGLFSTKVVLAVFFVFVLVYIGHSIRAFMTPDVNTMIVRMSTIEAPRSIPGVIIRDEHVFHAPQAGHVRFNVQEHQRVYARTNVGAIFDRDMADTAGRHLSAAEDRALSLAAMRPPSYAVDSGVTRINNNMTNTVGRHIHSFTTLSLPEIYALRDSLNQSIATRNQINSGRTLTTLDSLAREQDRHLAAYAGSSSNMYAPVSGIMSRFIDGHETPFSRAMIGELTREDVRREIEDYSNITPRSEVQEGDGVFKIVGNVWYVASYMPSDMVQHFTEGSTHSVFLYNAGTGEYEPHSMRIERIEFGTRYSLVVFRNTRHVIDFMNQRSITIRTTPGIRRGLEIPETAIVTRKHYRIPLDSIHGEVERFVVVSTGEGNTQVPISYDEYTEYYAYVPVTYSLMTNSLLAPRDREAGRYFLLEDAHVRVRHGVYMVNFGTVEFRHISLGDNSLGMGNILLDPSLNHGIGEFSNIVTDASTVVAGQILR